MIRIIDVNLRWIKSYDISGIVPRIGETLILQDHPHHGSYLVENVQMYLSKSIHAIDLFVKKLD
jgi:hypothetical protein